VFGLIELYSKLYLKREGAKQGEGGMEQPKKMLPEST
jgi:hypothetical protein